MRIHIACLLIFMSTGCLTSKSGTATSDVMLETDDRNTPETAKLLDMSHVIERHINEVLDEIRKAKDPTKRSWNPEEKADFLKEVSKRLAGPRRGSGVGVGSGSMRVEISVLTEIEAWLIENLDPSKHEIAFVPFEKSLYGANPVGIFQAKVPAHTTSATADHSVAPVIRLKNVIVGIDKLAHFLEQGYWYYDATVQGDLSSKRERTDFGAFMEGHPDLDKGVYVKYRKIFGRYCPTCVLAGGFGYYGSVSTGVISLADMTSNEDGFEFYWGLSQNIATYKFRIKQYDLKEWNEQNNKSLFVPSLIVKP
jgi:hypothetical protein